ncbi:U1 small nuclear ribonucleoprotein 70 kDa isoform X2 [Helicoverpa armigera]|uniref:U1 small nuclear ribonucleoprotein 70 kDa isoform X1 n=1 Tax=Helicoverpa zea TaxID=7113 RepID=UPI001F587AE4|nr:U1 small nuclear ribonucleoprotein 70 kDa isoform X1 [Helicoverpa zea]XP_049696193.1 U1 small nuclear ribonucleoprotein 70 kDa isoform X2 [Helicoverpa armigera]
MTQFLPPNLLALFAARDPIPYLPPAAKLPHEKKQKGYDGVGAFLNIFEHPSETPPPTRVETREERLERRRRERAEQTAYKLEQEIALWDPTTNARATMDPFKTLFVARINYDTSESKLRREFEGYGAIKKICMIYNKDNNKPRGYAFIEYEHERDMHSAYKHADGKKIDGKRVLVDVERARTVKGWLPRRLGGGLGGTRRGGADVNIKHSGREDNERERERYRLEQRERDERPRHDARPDRTQTAGGRRRSRSRSRRRSASRSRRRDRDRERERDREARERDPEDAERTAARRRRSSRSRSPRRRERRERDKERERERDKKRSRRDKERKEPKVKPEDIKIKEEPMDDYPEFSMAPLDVQIKQEPNEDENKYNPEDTNGDDYNY